MTASPAPDDRAFIVLLGFVERQLDRITSEIVVATALIGLFTVAYFVNPGEQKEGALIAAFAAAWGYFIGRTKTSKEDRDQLGDSIATTRAAVRVLSDRDTDRRTKRDEA